MRAWDTYVEMRRTTSALGMLERAVIAQQDARRGLFLLCDEHASWGEHPAQVARGQLHSAAEYALARHLVEEYFRLEKAICDS